MPSPAPRLAVDLSSPLIRVVDGALGGPMRCGSGGTPTGSLVDGRVLDPAAVGGALRQLLARTEIIESRALITASDALATFRVIRLPQSASEQNVSAAVARELPLDPQRMSIRWVDVPTEEDERRIYAVAWDRALINNVSEAARIAGLDPAAVDLRSACVARTAPESACVVVDLMSDPAEIVLIDRNLAQVWHSFRLALNPGEDVATALTGPLKSVLRFYKRHRDASFDTAAPILINAEQSLPSASAFALNHAVGHPVTQLPPPRRVPSDVRYATYLACIGLLMRRNA